MKVQHLIIYIIAFVLTACTQQPTNVQKRDALPEIYPDYVGVTIPVDIAPLDFAMQDDSVSCIDVSIKGEKGETLHANGTYADFDINEWHKLLQANKGHQLTVSVIAKKAGQWTQYRDFKINVNPQPLDAWGVTYRRIPPSYVHYSQMGIYQRCLSDFSETALIDNSNIDGQCVNCHTPNRTNPAEYVYHVRGEHGATVIKRNGAIKSLPAKNEVLGGSMVYPYWHPGGRYIAFSTNKTSQMFHSASNRRIEVYDSSSDVFIYDTEKQATLTDTLIMKKYWAENCPAFSPDGKWLYFTTAKRQIYPTDYDQEKYSLCRVSFDEATGKIGTQVDTLINARETGKSVTWPRLSYDGRYLMYTLADFGYFSVWHPEADLWLLDLQSGETSNMKEVNSERSESFHNWSCDSHWFLFTSRREDGLYTRLYFAHIDENGTATKPFLLPQKDPKNYYRRLLYSYNTPEFTTEPIEPTD